MSAPAPDVAAARPGARIGARARAIWGAIDVRGWIVIGVMVLVGLGAAIMLAHYPLPTASSGPPRGGAAASVVPKAVPAVMPLELVALAPAEAFAANEALPMVTGPLPSAAPFKFVGTPEDRTAATDCLTLALLYEAGDDQPGQQAVAQVILNRMRHPAFPNSVCGVVFQGSERTTGCQFTFTCDGAMNRTPNPAALARARIVATAALDGAVAKNVGLATHYHTDWVYPYWAPTLDKIARVHTHLFYRWKGWWGTRGAFLRSYGGSERVTPRLAQIMGYPPTEGVPVIATVPPSELATADSARVLAGASAVDLGIPVAELKGSSVLVADADRGVFVLKLDPAAFPGDYAMAALNLCSKRTDCSVAGYLKPGDTPTVLPLTPQDVQRAAFYYHSNKGSSPDATFWNCHQIPRKDKSQCLPGTR